MLVHCVHRDMGGGGSRASGKPGAKRVMSLISNADPVHGT
ncbi:MAG: hypothetical protein BWY09_01643 [Candidatus Hydrogenedentes bacterium ADurb.Bin179]|nr:MAG: hypothetical protein BWY09_01643 [Candidatus Hydrogenedentes bacterium ADurb.Bin179]